MAVSVIIPTRDRPPETARAVRSVLRQGEMVREVIVVDDASKDPDGSVAWAVSDPRVRTLRLDVNRGPGGARQAGIDEASQPWVAFLDSDDVWLPGKLAAQLQLAGSLRERGDDLVAIACAWRMASRAGEATRIRIPVDSESARDFLSGCWFSPGSTLLVARAAFDRVGPFDERLFRLEDYEWFIRFGRAGGRLVVSPVVGAAIHRGSRTGLQAVQAATATVRTGIRTLAPAEQRRVEAYLALECAAACRNDHRTLPMVAYLARSWLLSPRVTLPLKAFWRYRVESPARPPSTGPAALRGAGDCGTEAARP